MVKILLNENGQYDTNFNGIVNVKVFDKERIRRKRLLGSINIGLSTLNLRPIESFSPWKPGKVVPPVNQQKYLYISVLRIDR